MTTPQASDVNRAIIRAWRDPHYAASLSPETRDAMPLAPENIDALSDDQLEHILNDSLRMPLSDEQLSVAVGAGSNGVNENSAYDHVGGSPDQNQLGADNDQGTDVSPVQR